jgi:hypothetical protein
MTPSEIVNLVVAIASLVPTLVSIVVLIINIIKNKDWKLVMTIADEAMKTVELYSMDHPGMTSDEKLEMAIESVKSGLGVAGIKVDAALIKRIAEYIKESISWFNGMKK